MWPGSVSGSTTWCFRKPFTMRQRRISVDLTRKGKHTGERLRVKDSRANSVRTPSRLRNRRPVLRLQGSPLHLRAVWPDRAQSPNSPGSLRASTRSVTARTAERSNSLPSRPEPVPTAGTEGLGRRGSCRRSRDQRDVGRERPTRDQGFADERRWGRWLVRARSTGPTQASESALGRGGADRSPLRTSCTERDVRSITMGRERWRIR